MSDEILNWYLQLGSLLLNMPQVTKAGPQMSNELTKRNQDLLDSLNNRKAVQVSSLSNKLSNLKNLQNKVILCDTSGSMTSLVNSNSRRIDILNQTLDNFKGARIYEFNDRCYEVPGQLNPPHGRTNLGNAFFTIKRAGFKEVILLTDGEPDSEQDSLNEACNLKVNIIYIGNPPVPEFLKKLAAQSGGLFDSLELASNNSQKTLESKIKGFLK